MKEWSLGSRPVGRILFIGSSRMDVGRPPAIRLARSRLRIVSPQDGNNFDHPSRQRNHDRTGEKASLQIKPVHPSHADLTPTRPSVKPIVEDKRNSSVVCLTLQNAFRTRVQTYLRLYGLDDLATSAFRSHGFRILDSWSGRSKDSSSPGPSSRKLCVQRTEGPWYLSPQISFIYCWSRDFEGLTGSRDGVKLSLRRQFL